MANETEVDYDTMSDEEFESVMEENESSLPESDYVGEPAKEEVLEESDPKEAEEVETETEVVSDGEPQETEDTETEDSGEEAQENIEKNSDDETTDKDTEAKPDKEAEKTNDEVDYKEFYAKVTGEFKANGKMQQGITNPDDIIAGLQMHANYHKRMEGFNQYRPMIRTLQNNGLDDPDKLNKFISLDKSLEAGDTAALRQLMLDYNIDPIALDMEDVSYTPDNHMVTEQDANMYDTIDTVKGSESYGRALDLVTTKWDGASKEALSQNPRILEDLVSHMEDGTYDKVMEQVDYGMRFGKIPQGTSALEAYNMVLTNGNPTQPNSGKEQQPAPVNSPAKKDNTQAKKAAGIQTNKPAPAKKVSKEDDPMSLDDAAFQKYMDKFE